MEDGLPPLGKTQAALLNTAKPTEPEAHRAHSQYDGSDRVKDTDLDAFHANRGQSPTTHSGAAQSLTHDTGSTYTTGNALPTLEELTRGATGHTARQFSAHFTPRGRKILSAIDRRAADQWKLSGKIPRKSRRHFD